MLEGVIFDLDGVLVDSEQLWNQAKEDLVRCAGGQWRDDAPTSMMGMSSTEWAGFMHDELKLPLDPEEINRRVVLRMEELYRERLPLLPGAREVVLALGARWRLGLASSSNREIIDLVLELSGLSGAFLATVSSEEVGRGKPAPDVYLAAAERIGVGPESCAALEDSSNGLRSAAAAGMTVIAVPNPHYPPSEDALALASATVPAIAEVTPELVERATRHAALQVLVGTWETRAEFANAPPGGPLGRTVFEWMPGGAFLIQRWELPHPAAPDGVAVIGYNAARETCLQHYFDSRGVSRIYEMTLSDGTWTLLRVTEDFSPLDFAQRFTASFSDDGDTIAGRWETSADGVHWEPDFGLTYTRIARG